MISARLINSEAVLNNFIYVDQYVYIPGETLDIAFRLYHREFEHRFIPTDPGAIVTLTFAVRSTPNTPLVITASSIDALDRSMWIASLTPAQTLDLAGSNIQVTLDALGDGSDLSMTVIQNALARTVLSGVC